MKIGVIAAIHRYPVKSMMGEDLNAVRIGTRGVLGDRVFALTDPATGKIASAKNPSKWPALFSFRAAFVQPPEENGALPHARITFPDGSAVTTGDERIESKLSASLGKPVKFSGAPGAGTLEEYWPDIDGLARRDVVTDEAMPAETFFDCAAIHFLTTATLDSLRGFNPGGRFESRRFRPNLVIETPPGVKGFPENDDWSEKILAIGGTVKLKITGPCGRCVMTTLPQGDLPKDIGILKTAAQHNQARVGAYASVLQTGGILRGDPVLLESS